MWDEHRDFESTPTEIWVETLELWRKMLAGLNMQGKGIVSPGLLVTTFCGDDASNTAGLKVQHQRGLVRHLPEYLWVSKRSESPLVVGHEDEEPKNTRIRGVEPRATA